MSSLSLIADKYIERENGGRKPNGSFRDWRAESDETVRKIEALKKTSLFKGLTGQQYRQLSNICQEWTYPQYEIIFHQGDSSKSLFVMTKGQVKIFKDDQFLSDLSAPEVFGEVGFFYGSSRQYSVISSEETAVIEINKKKFMRLVTNDNLLLYSIHLNTIDEFSHHQKKYARIIAGGRNLK